LLTCTLSIPRPAPITVTYSYRQITHMNIDAFKKDILESKLSGLDDLSADEYADLINAEVNRILDIHA